VGVGVPVPLALALSDGSCLPQLAGQLAVVCNAARDVCMYVHMRATVGVSCMYAWACMCACARACVAAR